MKHRQWAGARLQHGQRLGAQREPIALHQRAPGESAEADRSESYGRRPRSFGDPAHLRQVPPGSLPSGLPYTVNVIASDFAAADPEEGVEACTMHALSLWLARGLPFAHW